MDETSPYFADDESGYGSESSIVDGISNVGVIVNSKGSNECVYDEDWITKTQGAMYSLLYSRLLSRLDEAAKRSELMAPGKRHTKKAVK